MLFSAAFVAFVANSAMSHVIRGPTARNWCGTSHPTDGQLARTELLAQKEREDRLAGVITTAEAIVVDTYFHIVTTTTNEADGYLSNATIQAQLDVMNDNYAPSGVSFVLQNVTYTINEAWAQNEDELAMKTALRQGDYSTLNVYFLTDLGGGLLGYSTFPDNFAPGTDDFYLDGLVILASSVPGGAETNYNEGKTVTHEAGHWFNLYHTFQGGCTGSGDYVDDTPAQSTPTSGCPASQDSCPKQPGLDPIHNYMDYSYDSCYTNFTPGQTARLISSWKEYRGRSSSSS